MASRMPPRSVAFVVPLIALKVAAAVVADHIPGGTLGTIDQVAGLAFGAARGAIVVCRIPRPGRPGRPGGAARVGQGRSDPALRQGWRGPLTRLIPDDFAARGVLALHGCRTRSAHAAPAARPTP